MYYIRRHADDSDPMVLKVIGDRLVFLSAGDSARWIFVSWIDPEYDCKTYASLEALLEADILSPNKVAQLLLAEI